MDIPKPCKIREQVIEDTESGLTLQFEVGPNGHTYLRVFGDALPSGNREFEFGDTGQLGGTGTATDGSSRPTWALDVDRL